MTIDQEFIATLPPNDPLFVAEFNPNLAVGFEQPALMRKVALILENVDGFNRPGVMRGVPHTLALLQTRLLQFPEEGTERPYRPMRERAGAAMALPARELSASSSSERSHSITPRLNPW